MNLGGQPQQCKTTHKPTDQTISMIVPAMREDMGHEGHGCGSCSKKDAKLRGARCSEQYYCDKECQKKDWFRHKACCRTPCDVQEMQLNADRWRNVFDIGAGA